MRLLLSLVLATGLCHAADKTAPLHPATYVHSGWAQTAGGQGGKLIRVTTLAADGPGSLKAALDTPGPRIVVFEVGGVIDMGGAGYKLREGRVTIAGQTAPDPGITLVRGELEIAAADVIVQHLSVRPGAYGRARRSGRDQDGITTSEGARRLIVDHCSFSWATDENLSVGGPRFKGATPEAWRESTSHAITFSHNLVYEGLGESVHAKGEHSKGTLIHDNANRILLLGNVYASNRERNALFKGGVWGAMVNNLIYNPGGKAVHYNLVAHEWVGQPYQVGKVTLVGNVYRAGPGTAERLPLFTLGGVGDVQLFEQDNLAVDRHGQPLPITGRYTTSAEIVPVREAYLPPGLSWVPPRELEKLLPLYVGARPWARDPLDFKQLSDIAEDRGQLIDDETQNNTDGLPKRRATQRAFVEADWNLADMSPKAGWASLFVRGVK
ncbi:MAG: pectate lyase family protein [Roseateles sp.]|uniref:pectate lyase family protein n=1 Tax=Roseateles sp. TaxID=1971397 RepID=UPI004035F59E